MIPGGCSGQIADFDENWEIVAIIVLFVRPFGAVRASCRSDDSMTSSVSSYGAQICSVMVRDGLFSQRSFKELDSPSISLSISRRRLASRLR